MKLNMEPSNLDIKERVLTKQEMEKLVEYFDGIDYLTQTMSIISANIAEAGDTEAANIWLQWMINASLSNHDELIEAIKEKEEFDVIHGSPPCKKQSNLDKPSL